MQRIVAEIDRLGIRLCFVRAPRFAPQPFLRKRENWHLVLGVVGQILVQIRQTAGVGRQGLVLGTQNIAYAILSEFFQVHNVESRNVIGFSSQMAFPCNNKIIKKSDKRQMIISIFFFNASAELTKTLIPKLESQC